jgi:tRNA (guanine37-N1)-methyltransferase
MRLDFITIFPRMFDPLLSEGVIARGVKQGLLDLRVWDLRDYATDKHRSTDDEAYGGGPGMVMLAEPVLRCVEAVRNSVSTDSPLIRPSATFSPPGGEKGQIGASPLSPLSPERGEGQGEGPSFTSEIVLEREATPARDVVPHLVMTSPQGRRFDQRVAKELSEKGHVVFLCGRYEGFDHRVHEALQPDEISIGDFVVSGGELPAMLMADAMGRLIPGVVGNSGSVEEDSFFRGLLDYPHYTRPEELRGMRIPQVLLSGHHEKIRKWRKEQALRATLEKRPDLLETAELDGEAQEILRKLGKF